MKKLTAIAVKALVKPGRYTDGDGLHLHVRQAKRKPGAEEAILRVWVFRYMLRGKLRDMGMGGYPDVSLAEARAAVVEARRMLRDGQDPLDARRAKGQGGADRTFRAAAERVIAERSAAWRGGDQAANWRAAFETYVYPEIGARHVQDVDTEAVLRILRPLWTTKPDTASRVRGRVEIVLDAATVLRWRQGENPARWRGHLAAVLPSPNKIRAAEHHAALPWRQVNAFVGELRAAGGSGPKVVELCILTAARSAEVRGMTWGEVDLEAKVWTVPARRMKAKRLHRVPLSAPALALLQDLREVRPADSVATDLVFVSGRAGKPLSKATVPKFLERLNRAGDGEAPRWRDGSTGEPIDLHGFRSTFRVWAGEETAYPRELIEAALAHGIKDATEAAYARTDLLERRRALMEDWGRVCGPSA